MIASACGVFLLAGCGLAVGSFLNVVIHRVPAGASVVSPPSHCPHCDTPIGWRDNVPLLGWLRLRGRARCCGEPISVRYPLVELATGLAFAGVGLWAGLTWSLPAFLYLAALSIALAVIDVDVHRLPDAIVLPSYPVVALLLVIASVAGADTGFDTGALIGAAAGGAALWALYFVLLLISPRSMGFGDVKLAGLLGAYLGWLGVGHVVVGAFLGFVLGGVLGAVLMLAGRAGRRTMIPFGPFMLAGAWIGIVAGGRIAGWYLGTAGI